MATAVYASQGGMGGNTSLFTYNPRAYLAPMNSPTNSNNIKNKIGKSCYQKLLSSYRHRIDRGRGRQWLRWKKKLDSLQKDNNIMNVDKKDSCTIIDNDKNKNNNYHNHSNNNNDTDNIYLLPDIRWKLSPLLIENMNNLTMHRTTVGLRRRRERRGWSQDAAEIACASNFGS